MELPLLEPVYKKFNDRGFEIIAIDVRADNKRAIAFQKEKKLTYPMLEGNVDMAVNNWQIEYTPSSFIIDRDGMVVASHGEIYDKDIADLEAEITKLLGE